MGALQPGLPSPIAIPINYSKIIIDLKDCFFYHPSTPTGQETVCIQPSGHQFQGPDARFPMEGTPTRHGK